jgi:hypothetical protein
MGSRLYTRHQFERALVLRGSGRRGGLTWEEICASLGIANVLAFSKAVNSFKRGEFKFREERITTVLAAAEKVMREKRVTTVRLIAQEIGFGESALRTLFERWGYDLELRREIATELDYEDASA